MLMILSSIVVLELIAVNVNVMIDLLSAHTLISMSLDCMSFSQSFSCHFLSFLNDILLVIELFSNFSILSFFEIKIQIMRLFVVIISLHS